LNNRGGEPLRGESQQGLIITPHDQPTITVDNLEIAQLISFLLKNEKIRRIIDAITSKVVLILGRFTEERKAVPDVLREELHRRDLTPVVFDLDKPVSKDITRTVETIARMARFVIAGLTYPSSMPLGSGYSRIRQCWLPTLQLADDHRAGK